MAGVTAIKKHDGEDMAPQEIGTGGIRLVVKLPVLFLVVGLVPFLITGVVLLNKAKNALTEQAFSQLESVREIKRTQVEAYFSQVNKDANELSELAASFEAESRSPRVDFSDKRNQESFVKKYGAYLKKFRELNGYGNILAVAPDGNILYSAAGGSDDHGNLFSGSLANTSLGRLAKSVLVTKKYDIADFAPYPQTNSEPTLFAAAPVMRDGSVWMIVALRVNPDALDQILQFRGGMGTTGESYMVGPDKLMRSDSFIENVSHTVSVSFANPTKGSVDTEAARDALAGNFKSIKTTDYNGRKVLSSYTPIQVGSFTWALLVEMEEGDEALAAIYEIKKNFFIIGLLGLAAIIWLAISISRAITRPIVETVSVIKEIAAGDFTKTVHVKTKDEIGVLGDTVNNMISELRAMMFNIKNQSKSLGMSSEVLFSASDMLASASKDMAVQASGVASATEQMSININSMAAGVEEASMNAAKVSSTAKQMSSNMQGIADAIGGISINISEVAKNTDETLAVANKAMEMSKTAMDTMELLGKAANEIGKVTEMIKRIAEQTNLLALNATIEAASAGDAGKGFAVVANEIKELANQSARAAEDIAAKIGGVQGNTTNAVNVITEVSNIIDQINTSVAHITKSVNLQTVAVTDISKHVADATNGANNIAGSIAEVANGASDMSRNAGEAARGANDVSSNIHGISRAVADNDSNSQDISAAAKEFSNIASALDGMVSKFKVEEDPEQKA